MATYVWVMGIIVLMVAGFFISRVDSSAISSGEKRFIVGLLSAAFYLMFILLTALFTEHEVEKAVNRNRCEFAKNSRTVFVECFEGWTTKTQDHYIYENYKDSTKVGVYKIKSKNDVAGWTGTRLQIKAKN